MKKLGIDARLYSQTGIGTYLRNLLLNLHKNPITNVEITVVVMENECELVKKQLPDFIVLPVRSVWHSVSEQTEFLTMLNKERFDLMHFTYFSYPYFYNRPFISTVHDLTPLTFKTGKASTMSSYMYELKHFVFRTLLKNQIKQSKKIITPTKTIKKQITATFGEQFKNKIEAIYEGMDTSIIESNQDISVLNRIKHKKYFLYVGNFYPHKNIQRLIEAFSSVPLEYGLVLKGPEDFFANRMHGLIKKNKLEDRVSMIHSLTQGELKALYSNAQALVHPSLSEGFGLPLIEAMYLNVPIIASNIDVFQELLGTMYTSFNPESTADIANKILQFIDSKPKHNYTGFQSKYSFKTMTEKHIELYKEVLFK